MLGSETIAEGRRVLEVVAYSTHIYWLLYASDEIAAKVGVGVIAMNNSSLLNLMMGVFTRGLGAADDDQEVSNAGSGG
jgi:hypothetical protein